MKTVINKQCFIFSVLLKNYVFIENIPIPIREKVDMLKKMQLLIAQITLNLLSVVYRQKYADVSKHDIAGGIKDNYR